MPPQPSRPDCRARLSPPNRLARPFLFHGRSNGTKKSPAGGHGLQTLRYSQGGNLPELPRKGRTPAPFDMFIVGKEMLRAKAQGQDVKRTTARSLSRGHRKCKRESATIPKPGASVLFARPLSAWSFPVSSREAATEHSRGWSEAKPPVRQKTNQSRNGRQIPCTHSAARVPGLKRLVPLPGAAPRLPPAMFLRRFAASRFP